MHHGSIVYFPKSIVVIAGPTGVGKTAYAIALARHFNTVVLSADSRQCYQELNIGVARPSPTELDLVKHYFIASHSVTDNISAAWYEGYALQLLEELFLKHDVVVVAGGTGLYIKALVHGLDPVPATDEKIRGYVTENYRAHGITWLQQQLQIKDPLFATGGEMQNPQRMMRALEVVMVTGKSILSYQKGLLANRNFNIIQLVLDLPRDVLYTRINKRVDAMIDAGLEEEAKALLPYRQCNALQTVGYQELFDYFDNITTMDRAIELIKQNTRHYAKRQLTWFKKQANTHWVDITGTPDINPMVEKLLNFGK